MGILWKIATNNFVWDTYYAYDQDYDFDVDTSCLWSIVSQSPEKYFQQ